VSSVITPSARITPRAPEASQGRTAPSRRIVWLARLVMVPVTIAERGLIPAPR
jgi:hypothetical protein